MKRQRKVLFGGGLLSLFLLLAIIIGVSSSSQSSTIDLIDSSVVSTESLTTVSSTDTNPATIDLVPPLRQFHPTTWLDIN